MFLLFFFFKQKTAYEMRISDWSSDVCSSDLADGTKLAAPLLIVAEGRLSPTRDATGFSIANWSYHHHAMIGAVAHEKPHGHVAHEIFYPSGPFALLPLVDDAQGRHRSAFVWTVSEKEDRKSTRLNSSH